MRDCKIKAHNMDGKYNNKNIAELFHNKYEHLFNLVPSDESKINNIKDFIEENVIQCNHSDFIVTEEEISKAIHELKNGKSDGDKGLISDHVKLAPRRFTTLLSILLSTARRHGYMPDEMLLSSLSSISKDKCANICDSNNYRGIHLAQAYQKMKILSF